MPSMNPVSTMQQPQSMGNNGGIMTTSIQSSTQQGSQQNIPTGIDTGGNLPNIPNPALQGQNKDRKIIWSGMFPWQFQC